MEELMDMAIKLHLVFIVAMILIACINLYYILMIKEFKNFSDKVHFIAPQYYMMMAALFLTGLVVMGVNKMEFSFNAILMIIVWFVIFMLSIKSYKRYKKTKTSPYNIILQKEFRDFAKKKYIIDISLLILTSAIAYMAR